MKDFVKNTTDLVNFGLKDSLAAVVLFSDIPSVNISLTKYTDKHHFKEAVDKINYEGDRGTDVPGALKLLQDAGLNGTLGLRSDTVKIVFVITDGKPNLKHMNISCKQAILDTQKIATNLHRSGIYDQVYSIGVKASNKPICASNKPIREVLNYIANPPSLVFPLTDFNATLFQKITQIFSTSFCNGE